DTVWGSDVAIVEVIAEGCFASFYRPRPAVAPGLCSGLMPAGSRRLAGLPGRLLQLRRWRAFLFNRPLPDEPGARVRLTLILLTATTILAATVGARPASGAPPRPGPVAPALEQPPERSVVGTLDQVDAAATAIVVKTPGGKQTFALQNGATI